MTQRGGYAHVPTASFPSREQTFTNHPELPEVGNFKRIIAHVRDLRTLVNPEALEHLRRIVLIAGLGKEQCKCITEKVHFLELS